MYEWIECFTFIGEKDQAVDTKKLFCLIIWVEFGFYRCLQDKQISVVSVFMTGTTSSKTFC